MMDPEMGAVARLQELVRAGDQQLEQYAKGCLANMRQTILVAATKRQVEVGAADAPSRSHARAGCRASALG